MPGDINTYALGIEFNLSATKAMDTLKGLSEQAANIEKTLSKAFALNIRSDDAQKATEENRQLEGITNSLNLAYRDIGRTLDEYNRDLAEVGTDIGKQLRIHEEWEEQLKDLKYELKELKREHKEFDVRPLIDQIRGLERAHRETSKEIKRNSEEWDKWAKTTSKSIDQGGKAGEMLIDLMGQIGPISSGTIKKALELGDSFGLLGKDINPLRASVPAIRGNMKEMVGTMTQAGKAAGSAVPQLAALGGEAAGAASTMGGASAAMGVAAAATGPLIIAVGALKVAYEGLKIAANAAAVALDKVGVSSSKAGSAVIEGIKSLNPFKMMLGFVTGAIEELIEAEEALRTETFRSIGTIDQATEVVNNLQANLRLTNEEATGVVAAMANAGIGAVTTRDKFEELGEQIAMFSITTGISREEISEYAMVLTVTGKSVDDITASLSDFTVNMRRAGLSAGDMSSVLKDASKRAPDLMAYFGPEGPQKYAEALGGLSAAFKKTFGPAGVGLAEDMMGKLADPMSDLSIVTGNLTLKTDDFYLKLENVGRFVEGIAPNWHEMSYAQIAATKSVGDLTAGQFYAMQQMKKTYGSIRAGIDAVKALAEEEAKAKELQEKFAEATGTLKQEMMRLFLDLWKEIKPAIKEIKPVLIEAAKSLRPLIKDIISLIPRGLKWFGELLKSADSIVRTLRIVWAVGVGTFEGIIDVLKPIYELVRDFLYEAGKLFGLIETGGKKGEESFSSLLEAIRVGARWTTKILTWLTLPITGIAKAFNMARKVVDHLFLKSIPGGASVAKAAVAFTLGPIKGLMKLAGFLLGYKPEVEKMPKQIDKTTGSLSKMGDKLSKIGNDMDKMLKNGIKETRELGDQFDRTGQKSTKMFDAEAANAKEFLKASEAAKSALAKATGLSVAELTAKAKAALTAKETPEIMATNAVAKAARPTTVAKPIKREIDKEMGRESKEAKYLKAIGQQTEVNSKVLEKIAELISGSEDPKKILEMLANYLPKIVERPSELGPAMSRW